MTTEIKYNNIIDDGFLGRNGNGKCSGLYVWEGGVSKDIWIEPFTSRGAIGRCWVRLPKENIQELIDALEKLK